MVPLWLYFLTPCKQTQATYIQQVVCALLAIGLQGVAANGLGHLLCPEHAADTQHHLAHHSNSIPSQQSQKRTQNSHVEFDVMHGFQCCRVACHTIPLEQNKNWCMQQKAVRSMKIMHELFRMSGH